MAKSGTKRTNWIVVTIVGLALAIGLMPAAALAASGQGGQERGDGQLVAAQGGNLVTAGDLESQQTGQYQITADVKPTNSGKVLGAGSYSKGATVVLTAIPGAGFAFDHWEVGDESKGESATYTFTVNSDQTVTAKFSQVLVCDANGNPLESQTMEYSGKPLQPEVKVFLADVDGRPNTTNAHIDISKCDIEYSNNVAVGKGKVDVKLGGTRAGNVDWVGSGSAEFQITPASIDGAKVSASDQVYTGKAIEPAPKVIWNDGQVEAKDFVASYGNNVNVGKASITVMGAHNFTETSKAYGSFNITKRPITITADSAKREYNGMPLNAGGFSSKGLAEGHRVSSAKVEGAQTSVGSSANTVSDAKIVNAAGEDVTANYDIAYMPGTLTVERVKAKRPARMTAKGRTGLSIAWAKVKGVAGYDVFLSRCNHDGKDIPAKRVATIEGDGTLTWSTSGLEAETPYKARVKAYVLDNDKKRYVWSSPLVHLYTSNGTDKYTNAKSVKVNKSKVTLKRGKSFQVKASVTKVDADKDLMPDSHVTQIRYLSTDKSVATVNSKGKIKAKGAGTCYVYAYAHNGVSKKIKVKVKAK